MDHQVAEIRQCALTEPPRERVGVGALLVMLKKYGSTAEASSVSGVLWKKIE